MEEQTGLEKDEAIELAASKATVVCDETKSEGTIDRVESDGTAHVWMGEVREPDGARITKAIHVSRLARKT